jgi:hypothetical protein
VDNRRDAAHVRQLKFIFILQKRSLLKGFAKISTSCVLGSQTQVQYLFLQYDPLESDVLLLYVLYESVGYGF